VDERPGNTGHKETYRQQLRLGVGYLRDHSFLRATLACSTTLNFFSLVVQVVLILYAVRTLGLGAGSIGLALGIGATGGLAGAALASRVARRIGTGYTIAAGAILFSLPFAFLPLTEGAPLTHRVAAIATAEFISGLGIMLFDINNNSLQAAVTDDSMRSHVSGAYATVNCGIRPVGAFLGGWTADHVGVPTTIVTASIAGTLAVIWVLRSPVINIRRVDDLEPHTPTQS
jgi:predicted MFS family arabinose efflux permease